MINLGTPVEVFEDAEHTKKEYEGTFLHFGVEYEEFDHGIGNYTIILILKPDGSVGEEIPAFVKFKINE